VINFPRIADDPALKRLENRLSDRCGVVHVNGLWGSAAPLVAARGQLASARPFLYVTAHLEEADHARDDLELFLGRPCELLPAWETLPGEGAAAGEIEAERVRVCAALIAAGSAHECAAPIIVAPVQALLQPVPTAKTLSQHMIHLGVGRPLAGATDDAPGSLLAWVVERGFERLERVESPGDVARRGEIVDLFLPGDTEPLRVEFLDERIESIRRFDVSTQRSLRVLDAATVTAIPRLRSTGSNETTDFSAHLSPGTIVVYDGPGEVQEMGQTFRRRLGEPGHLFSVGEVLRKLARFDQIHLERFGSSSGEGEDRFDFDVRSLARFEGKAAEAIERLCEVARENEVHVICDNEGERARLEELLAEQPADSTASIHLAAGVMHRGFAWQSARTVVVGHHEVFHRHRQRRRLRRLHAARPVESWMDLNPGDFVVHVVHGIGRYRDLTRMPKTEGGQIEEFLSLEFAEGARVHVPVSQIHLVQKYIGAGGRKPTLSTLGGKRWGKTKEQVAEAVGELAEELIRVQAARHEGSGIAYPADTRWQREFEASFAYEETEDQLIVAGEIRDDLMRARPADRLVCGDVGYGKTELAMRAAFKVVEFGRQVAVLVPTTVLAEQHDQTFRERLADYPFEIACLSRFRTAAEQKKIIDDIRRGRVDIVIGTHRLVSKDVIFKDLGLLIIDEEQRFGVEHKERLKAMRSTVDVLTLSATPIPRTMHMALVGIRDISTLQTPPVDRRSIATQVRTFDRPLIREAILREMNRDGQVYFVHNVVRSIAAMADTVRAIVPEARVVYAHGQMKNDELEGVMERFVNRRADVLVSTTIIESGIDNPAVNTIFINRAERFGLADLHQLRGRVGRSSHKAYCYLLLSPDRPPDPKAARRLKAIEEFSELGAGFRIAMRDLEIRGAGNLLGKEQSGHIASVGYEMYCQLLEGAVRRLKNEPDAQPPPCQIDLDVGGHVPRNYIPSDRSRIDIYRRLAGAGTIADLEQLEKDLSDAFGPFPESVGRLLELAELRVRARAVGVRSIRRQPPDVIFTVNGAVACEAVFRDARGSVRMPDARTIHYRPPPSYLEAGTLLPVLRRMFARAEETTEVAS
jgi:transcription-repair coupling factor (superfamily II helicase)